MSDVIPQPDKKTPVWMIILIVVCMLPALVVPLAITKIPDEDTGKMLFWFYPAYVICSGVCAYITYPKRPEVTWILLVLMLMTHAGMYVLAEGL